MQKGLKVKVFAWFTVTWYLQEIKPQQLRSKSINKSKEIQKFGKNVMII